MDIEHVPRRGRAQLYVRARDRHRPQRPLPQRRRRRLGLAAVGLVGLVGCYDPDVVDCSIACQAADECAEGQVCGADGYCAAPEIAGHCPGHEQARVALEISIDGDGRVAVDGLGTCDSSVSRRCVFMVPQQQRQRLKAIAPNDRSFESWSSACAGDAATCDVTPVGALTRVGAEFDE